MEDELLTQRRFGAQEQGTTAHSGGIMYVVNFGHPLSSEQKRSIEKLTGQPVEELIELKVHFDHARPFGEQAAALVDQVPLTPEQWQTQPLVVNPPSLAPISCAVLAELHGRMGYFPSILRMRPVADRLPPQYEVAEIIDLQAVRDRARSRR